MSRAIALFPLLFLLAWDVHAQTAPQPPNEIALIWQHVQAQPADFAVACSPLNRLGATVQYNGQPFPLASVSKLLIFIEYALRLDAGLISLDERVEVAALERYALPRTDRGAHDRFMAQFPSGTTSLLLWDVASQGMIQYSSNAASDYVLERLAVTDWNPLYTTLDLYSTTPPNALTMIPLLMNNHERGRATAESLTSLSMGQGASDLALYLGDEAWRTAEINYRNQRFQSQGRSGVWPQWDVQAAILAQHTANGNVNDFRNVMNAIYTENSPLNANVRYMVRSALQWRGNTYIDNNYVEYGSKLGFYSGGVITLVAYGQPLSGEPVISVTFLRNVPQRLYNSLIREDAIGDFAHWMNFNACAGLQALITSTLS
ncbi:MAG: serine hydrolase [Phototrophicaceae bacterium]|jgi:hypothetical protein